MKIVIDIDDNIFDSIVGHGIGSVDAQHIEHIIMNGTPYEEKPAEWIVYKDNYGNDKPVCSCCHKEQVGYANYCSYCGRRMKNGC